MTDRPRGEKLFTAQPNFLQFTYQERMPQSRPTAPLSGRTDAQTIRRTRVRATMDDGDAVK